MRLKPWVISLWLLATWSAPAAAQVRAPSLIDGELPEEEPARAAPAAPAPRAAPATAPAAAPAPEPPDTAALVRPIQPVRARPEDLVEAWQQRRAALREQDQAQARAAEARLLDVRAELGLESLDDLAAAEVRGARAALAARAAAEACSRAELAVTLAPDLAEAYWVLARARLASEPARPLGALSALCAGIAAAARSPELSRALLADALAGLLAGVGAAAAVVLALLLARRLRVVLHDFRHLPLLRDATPLQATFLGIVLLAAPLALRLGPAALVATFAVAAAVHLSVGERAVASAALLAIALLPAGAEEAARLTAWPGTLAADVHELEYGSGSAAVVARLEARAARGELPAPALLALAHHHKRRGGLDDALRFYREAGAGRPEALVGIGNVRLLQGDGDGAKAAYLAAVDAATAAHDARSLAAAHYDLSKVLLRESALEQSQRARGSAATEDAALVARYGSDEDFRANRWIIDVPLAPDDIRALAAGGEPRALGDAVRAAIAGPLPRAAWPWAPLVVAAALWPLALVRRRVGPGRACERCGRPACARCDAVSGALCGQCVNVFLRRAVVDPRDRVRKEQQVQRHAARRRTVARALAVAGGGAGHLWRGEPVRGAVLLALLLALVAIAATWGGVVPVRHPAPWLTAGKAGAAALLALAVWALAARDVFRRTRS